MEIDNTDLWQSLAENYQEYRKTLSQFFSDKVDRVALIRGALLDGDRYAAIEVARFLQEDERKQLFDNWVAGASTSNSLVHIYRRFILSLPHDWVMERIEAAVEPHLSNGDLDEWSRFLELYILLDTDLTRRLAERAAAHDDPEIGETGLDYLDSLKSEKAIEETKKGLLGDVIFCINDR